MFFTIITINIQCVIVYLSNMNNSLNNGDNIEKEKSTKGFLGHSGLLSLLDLSSRYAIG